jgi:hypothetical protein
MASGNVQRFPAPSDSGVGVAAGESRTVIYDMTAWREAVNGSVDASASGESSKLSHLELRDGPLSLAAAALEIITIAS